MKKYLVLAILTALVVPSLSFASIDSNLQYGMRNNPEVIEFQEFLIANNYLTGTATGNFLSLTLKGTKDYQTANGIPATGYVGKLTRASINAAIDAETASSTDQAVQETGTSTSFVADKPASPILTTLQQQNALLQQQIEAQQQTNKLLQSQAQNVGTITVTPPQDKSAVLIRDCRNSGAFYSQTQIVSVSNDQNIQRSGVFPICLIAFDSNGNPQSNADIQVTNSSSTQSIEISGVTPNRDQFVDQGVSLGKVPYYIYKLQAVPGVYDIEVSANGRLATTSITIQ